LIAISAISLGGCGQTITGTTAQMCQTIVPIYPSRHDTKGTLEQVAGHNAAREAWCGKPSKREAPQKVAQNG
jgi:hypothetical protein